MSGPRRPAARREPPRSLDQAEVDQLLALVATASRRDRAIVALFLYAGLRLDELRMLDRDDIAWAERRIVVRRGQGGQCRRLALHPAAAAALRAYLARRPDPDPALFLSRNRRRLSRRAIQVLVARFGVQLRPPRRITPRCLRRTFAALLCRSSGGDRRLVRRALGHGAIRTTTIDAGVEDAVLFSAMDRL